jgi:UDP-N-acetylmuramoyl-tripeptide--D-alanyl-D-alanine ligase
LNLHHEKPVIAITGSAGKTTVKTMVSAVLRERWIIFESKDYCNTTSNTKEHAQLFDFIHRAVVLEYGMAYPGVITEHCSIINPNIGIITNVGLAHIGNFDGNIEALAAAKSELIHGISTKGMLLINNDDQNSRLLHTKDFQGKIITVGMDNNADYKAVNIEYTDTGMTFVTYLSGVEVPIFIPMFGRHNVYNALFAIAVGDQLGFNHKEIQNGLRNLKGPNHRLDIHRLKDGIRVIDDTVHAHPPAMKAALDILNDIGRKQKIAILGSMPELGEKIDDYHRDIGNYVASKGIDFLYTYGRVSVSIGEGATKAGFPAEKVKHIVPWQRKIMHRELVQLIKPEATILVKGASRLDMYETVKFLCGEFVME